MRPLKKYFAILVIMIVIPVAWTAGKNFISDASTDIYSYIPQESDIVVEINTRNFISEVMYQRIFNEAYVVSTVEVAEEDIPTGIDYFSKVILFREQWADENVWVGVVGVQDEGEFKKFINEKIEDAHVVFGDGHAIIQMTSSSDQAKMDVHLKNIANKTIKPFTARVNLNELFKKDQEINCYVIPQSRENLNNALSDGIISMNFHDDHIDIKGEFGTMSEFETIPTIKYPLNDDAALSMRSSLNIFNSIWWFSKEQLEDVPTYDQMAIDYDGLNLFMCDPNLGYPFPFKTFPEIEMRFDIADEENWQTFFAEIVEEGKIRADTTTKSLVTEQGAFFQYELTDKVFELSRQGVNLEEAQSEDVYFDFQMKIADLLNKTKFAVDVDNPPPLIMQTIGIMAAESQVEEMHAFDKIEQITFTMSKKDEKVIADGMVQMQNREGQSIVESMFFISEALFYVQSFLTSPAEDTTPVVDPIEDEVSNLDADSTDIPD